MISFIHAGGPHMASYRYRVAIPARELNARINDLSADVVIFSKPTGQDVESALNVKRRGGKIIVDFCDDHMTLPHYRAMLDLADAITCPTEKMAERLRWDAQVIPDAYEFDESEPHCNGNNILWFGHAVNFPSLQRILPDLGGMRLRVVSNVPGCIPWSLETMRYEFSKADIVIIPYTKDYKSPNRAIEAIRQGCFVVAEPHPSLKDFPGIWIGNIKEGVEWAQQNLSDAKSLTKKTQNFVLKRYSPQTQANAWRKVIQGLVSISEAERFAGMDGSVLTETV
jgi:hypothetical protein